MKQCKNCELLREHLKLAGKEKQKIKSLAKKLLKSLIWYSESIDPSYYEDWYGEGMENEWTEAEAVMKIARKELLVKD
jgi:hypothetical protein